MQTSFYSDQELSELGLKSFGKNVRLSRKASIYNPDQIEIGNNVRIDDFCILSGRIRLGNYIHIAAYSGLFGSEGITMEDYSGLSSRVSIYTVSEDYLGNGLTNPTIPAAYRHPIKGPVTLEKHVILGVGAVVLPGVTISIGTAIGALALVSSNCEPWKIYVGIPAKAKRERRSDIILAYQSRLEAETQDQNH
ncbi:MAG: acyltransferase [Chloroflexi bacterium]|nr:acyltransferase [Chloroflexota bacterium]